MATAKGKRTALKFGIEDFKTYFYDSINDLLNTKPIPPAITTYHTEITDVLNRTVRNEEDILLVENLKNRSLVFLIVLLRLADVKKSFSSLKTQIDKADKIFDGIFELAKNVVEHSSTRRGSLTITSITENVIKQMAGEVKPSNAQKLKKGNGWRRNPALWASYYSYVTKSQLQFFHKNNKYLDISIADTGTVGIIESAIKELNDKIGYFKSNSTVQGLCREDIETITNLIRSSDDEAKLLYDLYFNRSDKGIELNTQSRNAYRGLGIYLFTKFVNAHYGIFNTQTNKYREQSSTTNFSSFDGAYQRSNFESPEIFGTRYNIIIPILYESNETRESDSEGTNANVEEKLVLSKGVYEKMLPLSKHFITKDEESRYFLGGLSKYKLSKYVIRHNFGKDNEALVLSLWTKIFRGEDGELLLPIDRTKIFRAVSQLFDGNESIKTVIIKDISAELTKGLVEIYSDFVFSDNEECLLLKDRLIMFIVEDKQMDSVIEGHQVAIVTGDCIESCKKINQYVSEKNRDIECFPAMCRPWSKRERTKIETMLDRHHLFDKGQIIALDYFEKGAARFEIKAQQKLEKSIEDDGYNWKTTHLKIGSKLHLNDFVYGKKMFQQSKEVSAFAFDLARHIFYRNINRISRENNKKSNIKTVYTLIGYGYYSELLVSQTRDFVNWLCWAAGLSPLIQIEHTIIEDDDNIKFYRYLHDKKLREESFEVPPDERLIIIVPISSTLTTCLKIENKLRDVLKDDFNKRRNRFKIEQPFYTVVVVGDKFELKELRRDLNKKIKEYSVVEHYWKEVLDDQIVTYNRERGSRRRNRFSIYIQSGWELPENCQHCFPDNPIQERPLFITDKVSVTPNLVFDAPEWYSLTDTDSKNLYFKFPKDDLSLRSNDNPVIDTINRTHYESETTNTHLSYYLDYLDFINANKENLEQWAKKIKVKFGNEKEVLLIVPDKAENGEFINLINREIFDNKANIIRFDQSSDHYLNFDKFFGKDVNKAGQAIYFVDNSMISGRTFKMIDSTLSHLGRRRIKGIFSLINRVDPSCYNELTECLKENADDIQNHHYSFVNLYLPESTAIPCPQCDERDKYIKLIENASLDCVKQYYIDQELSYLERVSKEKLIENNQRHKPLEKRHDSTLLKVVLTHFLNKAFADSQPFVEQIDISGLPDWSEVGGHENFFRFNKFVDEFREYIKGHDQCNMDIIKPLKFKANLIKVLASHPFKKHRGINIAVFYWILNDLIVATKTVLGDGYPFEGKYENVEVRQTDFTILNAPSKNYDLYIDTVNYLRVLIKYAASLNMAYLLHSDFLACVSKLNLCFNNITSDEMEGDLLIKFKKMQYSLDNFKLFCAAHIVSSLHRNEQRAVRLEKNVNKLLQEESGKGHDTSFEELLVLENTEIIRKTLNATKLKRKYSTKQEKESVPKEEVKEKEVKEKDMPRDYKQFVENEYHHNRDVLKYTHELKEIFQSKKDKRDRSSIEDEARKIIRLIASIAGYEIDGDMPQGGGVLLYKYQNIGQTNGDSENDGKPKSADNGFDSNNYIVIANEGDNVLANLYADMPDHCLASEMLEGKTYLESKEDSESGGFTCTWTNYTAHLNKSNNWVGHKDNGKHEDLTQYDDLNCLDKKHTKRVLFIRISKQGEHNRKNSKGDALFVFYDNNDPNGNYNSIHSLRYLYSLRKEINDYFEKRYRNDSFRNWVEERRIYEDILSTEHHHKHQMKKLRDCAIDNPDRDKLEFHWRTISDIKPIRDFIKCGKFSIFEDIVDLEIKKQIDFYRRFMLSSHLDNIVDNRIDEPLQIRFSEMIFRQIMCEYLDNINQAMHNFTDTLGVGPKVIIDARREEDAIIISIQNNFLMNTEQADKMKSINELGYYVSNSLGGLTTNRKLLMKTGLEKPEISMKNTDVDGIGEFIIEFKLKNIVHNENN